MSADLVSEGTKVTMYIVGCMHLCARTMPPMDGLIYTRYPKPLRDAVHAILCGLCIGMAFWTIVRV